MCHIDRNGTTGLNRRRFNPFRARSVELEIRSAEPRYIESKQVVKWNRRAIGYLGLFVRYVITEVPSSSGLLDHTYEMWFLIRKDIEYFV